MKRQPPIDEAEILRRLRAGEPQRTVGRALDLNPVTVGRVAKRNGLTYPQAQASSDARRGQVLQQTERAFQAQVVELAGLLGWLCYHTWLSKHSTAGFPDLVLVRAPRVIFAELKTDTGRMMPAQETWRDALAACPGVEMFVWRPSSWEDVVRALR